FPFKSRGYRLRRSVILFYVVLILWLIQGNRCFNWPKINSVNPYCYVRECCNDDWIYFNKQRLIDNLTEKVFGQPLLLTAVDAIVGHLNPHYKPKKALTLSFHGMTGTGKNYVSKFILDNIYREGIKSKYVHTFIGRMHFSEEANTNKYKENLYQWLKNNVTKCSRQLFIFDEVDKMIPEVLNAIKPYIDYRDDVDGVDYTKSIFLFLSNTGADIVNEHYHDLHFVEGKNREDLTLADFEPLIKKGIFNEKGGFFHSDAIKHNLIDHFIPFLPLEEKHIRLCIKDEFKARNVHIPDKKHIQEILDYVEWGPDSSKSFSKTGCKGLSQKVALLVAKHSDKYFPDKDEL
ncbi:torsin-1A-like, partial [Rhynchophorus ferrugineus]|uniref:torsin-1A-like n=1 Tax=Rhynchophorus ferrugineus TaxID=354439 RepID=UPI003FCC7234